MRNTTAIKLISSIRLVVLFFAAAVVYFDHFDSLERHSNEQTNDSNSFNYRPLKFGGRATKEREMEEKKTKEEYCRLGKKSEEHNSSIIFGSRRRRRERDVAWGRGKIIILKITDSEQSVCNEAGRMGSANDGWKKTERNRKMTGPVTRMSSQRNSHRADLFSSPIRAGSGNVMETHSTHRSDDGKPETTRVRGCV